MSLKIEVDTRKAEIYLNRLANFTREAMPRIVQMATRAIYDEMKQQVPVKTGRLRASILQFSEGDNGVVSTSSGYGKFVDEDTRAHEIRARYVRFLRFEIGGRVIFRKKVNHPGTTGYHFTQKSVEAAKPQILANINDILREGL